MNRKAPAALAASMAALVLVACGGSDESSSSTTKSKSSGSATPRTVVGGSATWVPAPAALEDLANAGIKVAVGSGAKKQGRSVVVVFRDGKMVKSGLIGKAESRGTIGFVRGDKRVDFEDVIVDTARRRVTGVQDKDRIILFLLKIKGIQQTTLKNGSIGATGLSVKLSPGAAKRLNEGLGVNIFKEGQRYGTVALAVRLKKSTGNSSSGKSGN